MPSRLSVDTLMSQYHLALVPIMDNRAHGWVSVPICSSSGLRNLKDPDRVHWSIVLVIGAQSSSEAVQLSHGAHYEAHSNCTGAVLRIAIVI